MAASFAIFQGWDRPIEGRESQAAQLYKDVEAYWSRQKSAGNIESWEMVLLAPHGGALNGFFLIRGDRDKLQQLQTTNDFIDLTTRQASIARGFSSLTAFLGDSALQQSQRFHKHAAAA